MSAAVLLTSSAQHGARVYVTGRSAPDRSASMSGSRVFAATIELDLQVEAAFNRIVSEARQSTFW